VLAGKTWIAVTSWLSRKKYSGARVVRQQAGSLKNDKLPELQDQDKSSESVDAADAQIKSKTINDNHNASVCR
jgi:hypothetical protein